MDAGFKRILLTGMSATGKSTAIAALRELGYHAVDLDEPGWSRQDEFGAQRWHCERVEALLCDDEHRVVFICGCSEDQGQFYPLLSHIILLSVPEKVMIERLDRRTNNAFGKRPEERARILADLEAIEPLLRAGSDYEIDTRISPAEVVKRILEVIDE